jgi:peptide/nickel transport system substrate-binding protein
LNKQRLASLSLIMSLLLATVMILTACGTKTTTTASAPPATTAPGVTTSAPPKTTTTATTAPAVNPTTAPAGTTATTAPAVTTAAPPAKAAPTGNLRIALQDFSWESFDPIYYESTWGWTMYDSLLTWDKNGNYIGQVAESYSIAPDGVTWTFKIRKDIKFWNGEPLTAADVKFSVDRFGGKESTNPWSRYISEAYNKKSSAVIDTYTFQFVSVRPEPAQVIAFAWTRILPKNYFEKVGMDAFRKLPMGSGPWKYVSNIAKTRCIMEANTDYWDKSRIPGFKTLTLLLVPEEATQVNMLKNNEVDMITVGADSTTQLMKSGFKVQEFGLPADYNFNFQGTWLASSGPPSDIRVRKAMSFALNRNEIAKGFFNGMAEPGGRWFMQPGAYGWDPAWKADPYDPVQAKALLAEAGYPSKWPNAVITIFAPPGPQVDFITLMQGYWKEVGIKTKLEIVDSTVWGGYFFNPATRLKDGDKNVGWIWCWVLGSTQNNMYHSANMYTSTGAHNTMNDPVADQLYKDATTEPDPAKALAKWTAFHAYCHDQYISIGVVMVKPISVIGPNIASIGGRTWIGREDSYDGFVPAKK